VWRRPTVRFALAAAAGLLELMKGASSAARRLNRKECKTLQ